MSVDSETFYKRLGRPLSDMGLQRRKQDVLYDKKWKLFLKRAGLFRHIPFVEFALGSGSMALGSVHENSDLDALVGVKYGRIFTSRAFCILAFGALGWRRNKLSHAESAKDKICMHHFVTDKSYKLQPPYNVYWQEVYGNLVPIFGSEKIIQKFFNENTPWMAEKRTDISDLRHKYKKGSFTQIILEKFLSGVLGEIIERKLKNIQMKRIESGLESQLGFEPRIKYTDHELEFLPSTSRIHALTNQ